MNEYKVRGPDSDQVWTIFARKPKYAAERWAGELECEYQEPMWVARGLRCVVTDKEGVENRYVLYAEMTITACDDQDEDGGGA